MKTDTRHRRIFFADSVLVPIVCCFAVLLYDKAGVSKKDAMAGLLGGGSQSRKEVERKPI